MTSRAIALAARPSGFPTEDDFRLIEETLAEPAEGEVLVRIHYLSVDPYMRGRMNDARSYADPVGIGQVMVGSAVGRVEKSRFDGLTEGDWVECYPGWREYAVVAGRSCRKLDPSLAPVSTALGILGMPGMTAYFGLLEIGQPKEGETVVVSGAAGAVGSVVGQIAKIAGCRAVGIAGSDEKVAWIRSLGFDAGFNYKTETDYVGAVRKAAPGGVDVYFDNVGGAISDAVIRCIKPFARISICGQISQYNLEKPEMGPRMMPILLVRQARAQGFLVFQFADRYAEGRKRMAGWLREGKLQYREQFVDGLDNAPLAFLDMLRGGNIGKQLVRVAAA